MPKPFSLPPAAGAAATLRQALLQAVTASPLSREALAEKAGLSRQSLYNLLEGKADPRLSSVEALAHALELDLFVAPKALAQFRMGGTAPPARSVYSAIAPLLARHGRTEPGS